MSDSRFSSPLPWLLENVSKEWKVCFVSSERELFPRDGNQKGSFPTAWSWHRMKKNECDSRGLEEFRWLILPAKLHTLVLLRLGNIHSHKSKLCYKLKQIHSLIYPMKRWFLARTRLNSSSFVVWEMISRLRFLQPRKYLDKRMFGASQLALDDSGRERSLKELFCCCCCCCYCWCYCWC